MRAGKGGVRKDFFRYQQLLDLHIEEPDSAAGLGKTQRHLLAADPYHSMQLPCFWATRNKFVGEK